MQYFQILFLYCSMQNGKNMETFDFKIGSEVTFKNFHDKTNTVGTVIEIDEKFIIVKYLVWEKDHLVSRTRQWYKSGKKTHFRYTYTDILSCINLGI